jgi:hypothetical protein
MAIPVRQKRLTAYSISVGSQEPPQSGIGY